jgi:uncharacterized protein
MLSLLPDYADPVRLCALGKAYEGKVALAGMSRLEPLLTSLEGEAVFALAFDMDGERRPVIRVDVQAVLSVQCQRCMQPMAFDVDSSTLLAVVSGPDEAERLPVELDPLLLTEGRVELRSLIEDELILAIPPAPMHPEAECAVQLDSMVSEPERPEIVPVDDEVENPFAVLASLKSDTDKQD